jgi:quinol monooxygenase YgiN
MSISRRDFVAAVAAASAATSISTVAQSNTDKAVYVVATITVKEGKRDELVRIFSVNVPNVHAEVGCLYYEPVVDVQSGIPSQKPMRPNVMVVVEKWESLDKLLVHLDAPHMKTYREAVKDLIESVDLQVLQHA